MSPLLDRSSPFVRPAVDVPPSALGAPVQAALRAAAGGLVPVAVPVVIAWVLGAGGEATWAQTVRFCLGLWLLAQHAGLAVADGHVGLVPLGLALVPLTSSWFAGRRLARTMDPRADRIAAGATRAVPKALSWRVLAVFVGAYGLVAALASIASGMDGMRPVSAQAVVGALVVATCGGGLGAAGYRYGGVRAAVRGLIERLPLALQSAVRPALAAQAVQVAAGALIVGALLVVHFSGVTALYGALGADLSGTVVLTLGQVMLLPNLSLWTCAVMAGPGFSVGTGTSVTVVTSHLGPLPAIPVLAALPAPGGLPGWAPVLLAVPVLAGVVAGIVVIRWAPDAGTLPRLRHVGGAGVLSGVLSGALAWLSGGPAGPGRLAEVGPDPALTGLAAGLEVLVGATVAVLAATWAPVLAARARRVWLSASADGDSQTSGFAETFARAFRPGTPSRRNGAATPADDARNPGGTASGPGS
jgi:hypothetical protein